MDLRVIIEKLKIYVRTSNRTEDVVRDGLETPDNATNLATCTYSFATLLHSI